MTRKPLLAFGIAVSTCLALPTAAFAEGKTDLARKAIAAAQAKVDAANIVGASGDAPRLHAEAVSAIRMAQDELNRHDKDAAIRDANRASGLADQALIASQRQRTDDQRAGTVAAQSQADAANARAADSQAAAAAAQADAAAARAAPPVVVTMPAPVAAPETTTTVSTTDSDSMTAPATPVAKRTVHRTAKHRRAVHHGRTRTTTTTVRSN